MSNPTTPFSWQMPTNTDLVTDLPADFEVFGQAVATSMADLLGGTTGQVLSKTTNADMDFTWVAANPGDITNVGVTSPINGGGSSGSVTIGIDDATTSVKGAVQLSDSTSTTSSVLAATPTAVKSAYDLANGAIAKTTVTTAGDVIYRNATVPTRLAIGTAGQILTVNSGATAPQWSTATAPAQNFSLLNSGGTALTGSATVTVSGISGMNMLYVIVNLGSSTQTTGCQVYLRINADSGSNYYQVGGQQSGVYTYPITSAAGTKIGAASFSSNANSAIWGGTMIFGCNSAGIKMYDSNYATDVAGGANNAWQGTSGYWSGSATVSSISIITADGTWDAGTIYIYGSA